MTLLDRDPNAPAFWSGDLPVTSRYTYGLAGERFFRKLKEEGQILGSHCHICEHTYVPATNFCERCLGEITDWQEVGTVGTVYTYTLLYEKLDGTFSDKPEAIAFIRIGDGGLVHYLGEVDPEQITIDMKVEAVIKPADQREGSILDIEYFKPLK
jgi:uncharacterized OB-fold protein